MGPGSSKVFFQGDMLLQERTEGNTAYGCCVSECWEQPWDFSSVSFAVA